MADAGSPSGFGIFIRNHRSVSGFCNGAADTDYGGIILGKEQEKYERVDDVFNYILLKVYCQEYIL